jgi:Ca-activated chloride channel family protein
MKRLLAAVILILGVSLAAQQPTQTPAPDAPETRITLEVNRVDMLFTVTDKKGRFITDLGKDDFQVLENKQPQVIQEFTAESNLPLRIAILVDTSNSIRDRFKFEQQAAIDFVNSVIRPEQDRAMIVSFDSSAELVADLIGNPETLAAAIRSLRPGGGTALYDALYYACRDKLQLDKPRYRFRRAVIIVSDGEDNQSRVSRDQALEMAQKADAVIYCISTNITRIESDGDKLLKYLSQETGGQSFFPFKPEDLAQSFENIANELRHQYAIFYRPEPFRTDGLYHTVALRVKSRHDVIVRARKGYYAPKM